MYVCVSLYFFRHCLELFVFVIMLVGAMLQYPHTSNPHTCCYSKQKMTLGHSTLCIIRYRKSYISYTIPN